MEISFDSSAFQSPPNKPRVCSGYYDEFESDLEESPNIDLPKSAFASPICSKGEKKSRAFSPRSSPRRKPDRETLRKKCFSIESKSSMTSLASMASVVSGATSYRSECEDNDDDESTIEDDNGDDASAYSSDSSSDDIGWCTLDLNVDLDSRITVQTTWEGLSSKNETGNIADEEDDHRYLVGEQTLHYMIELEPKSRASLGISSYRSPRYGAMCLLVGDTIEQLVEKVIPACTPFSMELHEEFVLPLAHRLIKEGFDMNLVKDSALHGIKSCVEPHIWDDHVDRAFQDALMPILQIMARA